MSMKGDDNGDTPLIVSILSENEKIFEKLLKFSELKIWKRDKKGFSPMEYALFCSNESYMKKIMRPDFRYW